MAAYVYGLFDGDAIVYIGKGTGRRLRNQERTFRLGGRVLKEFKTEREAFAYERMMIAECKPILNRCSGGNGGTVKRRRSPPRDKLTLLAERIGCRRVSVAILAAVNRVAPHLFSDERLAAVCQASQCTIEYLTHAGR